jgi:hypothetical protein
MKIPKDEFVSFFRGLLHNMTSGKMTVTQRICYQKQEADVCRGRRLLAAYETRRALPPFAAGKRGLQPNFRLQSALNFFLLIFNALNLYFIV